jgi:hypothetical protein
MLKTRLAKEVTVRMENEIGTLDSLAKAIAERGVNVLGVCAWVEGAQAVIRVLTDDSVRVLDTLKGLHYEARESDVLVTEAPHKPGMLHRITATLAKGGLDIHHLYATGTHAQDHSLVVFATANNDRALVLLNAAGTGG